MTLALDDLYRNVILDHHRHPRNFRAIDAARTAEGSNPLCGDRITVYLHVADDVIVEAGFQGYGCAIATASASLMTEAVTGGTVAGAVDLAARVRRMVEASPESDIPDVGAIAALAGVRRFPARAKCAVLPWRALEVALEFDRRP